MDVASPLRVGTAVHATGSDGTAARFDWTELATKFFAVIGDAPVDASGYQYPMAQGEGVPT